MIRLSLPLVLCALSTQAQMPPQIGAGSAASAIHPAPLPAAIVVQVDEDRRGPTVHFDRARMSERDAAAFSMTLPVEGGALTLELERFRITTPASRFVIGGPKGDQPMDFDPESVLLLRGRAAGYESSHAYLAIADTMINGIIDLGPGYPTYGVSSRAREGGQLPVGQAIVFQSRGSAGPTMMCQVIGDPHAGPPPADVEPRRGLRQIQLAVETDNEFFQVLQTQAAAAAYLVQLYGAVSDIYMREINTRVDLVYTRIWPLPNEPFQPGLNTFQSYWQANMQSVQRDAAQMYSGRADMPGGVAYLSSLCNSSAYSFCGNVVGFFADPLSSSVFNYDPLVTAHELGHNSGTGHTHDYGLDACQTVSTPARRGTIMSYCNQTISGAMAVEDLGFHKVTRQKMLDYLVTIPNCVSFDCNQNGISDASDILSGTSLDTNSNGVPDECEDCNHNGVLDSVDIANGTSFDLNANGIPDSCEPDCNHNGVPDDRDIALGTSQDLYGDGIPDECDANLNNANGSDYNEIMADMALDKDRNRTLDSAQDCDGDTIPDLTELQGAHDGWAASSVTGVVREYHSVTGVLMRSSAAGATSPVNDLLITTNRRVLVAAANGVVEFNSSGGFVRVLVAVGSGGLASPSSLLISATGELLVADRTGNAVRRYNLSTGASLGTLVTTGLGGLSAPMGLARSSAGTLLVTSETNNQVNEYNATTGAFIRVFVAAASGGLSAPKGLVLNPLTSNILVSSFGTNQILEYNGTTGAFIKVWSVVGVHFDGPWALRIGPDKQVYVSANTDPLDTHITRAHILIFDARTGFFVRSYVQADDSLLTRPTGFDFMPGTGFDCNRNQVPDSCDIATGFSSDVNQNAVPDECERTCYANCDLSTAAPVLNALDFGCFLGQFAAGRSYANCDGSTNAPVLNALDFSCFLSRFAAGCP